MKFRLVENIEEFAWLENFDNVKDISNEEFVRQVLSNNEIYGVGFIYLHSQLPSSLKTRK